MKSSHFVIALSVFFSCCSAAQTLRFYNAFAGSTHRAIHLYYEGNAPESVRPYNIVRDYFLEQEDHPCAHLLAHRCSCVPFRKQPYTYYDQSYFGTIYQPSLACSRSALVALLSARDALIASIKPSLQDIHFQLECRSRRD